MSTQHLSEQEQLRREKLAELIMMGIDPYPAPLYPVNTQFCLYKRKFYGRKKRPVCRCMHCRPHHECTGYGQSQFCRDTGCSWKNTIVYHAGMIFAPAKTKRLYDIVWKKLLDIGDIIGIKGYVFITKTGETSIHVKELTFLANHFVHCQS